MNSPQPKTTDLHGLSLQAYPLPETRIRCRRPECDGRSQVLAIALNVPPVRADRQSDRGTPTKNRADTHTGPRALRRAIRRAHHAHRESDNAKSKWHR